MIIIGVDPGTRATGFGVIEVQGSSIACREYGVINAKAKLPLADRLNTIYEGLDTLFTSWQPDIVSVEKAFYGTNVQTALTLGHARGVILLAAFQQGATIAEFTPTEIKKTVVGNGHATKEQVEFMVQTILRLPKEGIKNDAFDGLAAALCANNNRGFIR